MKNLFLTITLALGAVTAALGQLSVGYHQSALPFVAIGYEIDGRLMPELRLSTDISLEDNFSPEFVLAYQFLNKDSYEFYAGLGYRANTYQGPLLPIGFNFFPLERKHFGLHLELAPMLEIEGITILRGSWGIRYRFAGD